MWVPRGPRCDPDEERVLLLNEEKETGGVEGHTPGTSWYGAVFLVVNAALGAGLLNFSQAYQQAGGILISIIVQAVFMIFIVGALIILAYCSDVGRSSNYQEVVYSMCGKNALMLCALAITIYCFGTSITFLIIIGDQWEEFFLFVDQHEYCNSNSWYMTRTFITTVTSFILILPLCFPKRIDFLKYARSVCCWFRLVPLMSKDTFAQSYCEEVYLWKDEDACGHKDCGVGVFSVVYVVILVAVKYLMLHSPPQTVMTSPNSWLDVFMVVPTICFAYQCHVSVIPIYSCMEKRTLEEFSKTIAAAMTLCILIYTSTAIFGFLMFGNTITSDILLSFKPDVCVVIAVALIALKTYLTYPILLFCGRAGLESIWLHIWKMSAIQFEQRERLRRILMTVFWFAATLILSLFIPNIGVVIAALGSLAAVFIFVFPGMCLFQVALGKRSELTSWRYRLLLSISIAYTVLGAFIFGVTVTQTFVKDSDGSGILPDKSESTC